MGLYPGISPWAFMQGGLICGGIGYMVVKFLVLNLQSFSTEECTVIDAFSFVSVNNCFRI